MLKIRNSAPLHFTRYIHRFHLQKSSTFTHVSIRTSAFYHWPLFLAVLCYVQLTQTNCWYHGPARPALDCIPSVLVARLPGMICRLICALFQTVPVFLFIMRPSSLGGAAYCVALCLSVCPSVRPSRPLADVLCLQLHRLTSEHPK